MMAEKLAINWDPPATIYMCQADLFCPDCAHAMQIDSKPHMDPDILQAVEDTGPDGPPIDWSSDHWPVPFSRGEGESDTPDHCGSCHRFLGRNLTAAGIAYVGETASEELDRDGVIGEVVQGWLDYYEINVEGRYLIAEVLNNGEWGILEAFEATDDGAANDYAEEHYSHIEWYVLYQSTRVNING